MKRYEQTTKSLRMSVATTRKIAAYSQKVLGGAPGLTSEDIALGVGTDPKVVRKKMRTTRFIENWARQNFLVVPVGTSDIPESYVFDVNAAKAFVATYDNERGREYLAFLLDCERAALETLPKLKELVKKLTKPKRGTLPNGDSCVTLTQIEVRRDIFGTEYFEPLRVKVRLSDLDDAQRAEYKLRHINKVQSGLTKSAEKALSKTVFMTPSNIKQLRPTDKE